MLDVIADRGLEAIGRYYSKYRAIVVNNTDPDNMGKLAVTIPQLGMNFSVWAYPCGNEGSLKSGFKWLTPMEGSIVYIEFQMGDPLYPLWSYHGWAKGEVPDELKGLNTLGFVTPNGNKVILNDSTGEFTISIRDPKDTSKELISIRNESDVLDITCKTLKVHGDIEAYGEVTSVADGGLTKTDLSTHKHTSAIGPTNSPIPEPV